MSSRSPGLPLVVMVVHITRPSSGGPLGIWFEYARSWGTAHSAGWKIWFTDVPSFLLSFPRTFYSFLPFFLLFILPLLFRPSLVALLCSRPSPVALPPHEPSSGPGHTRLSDSHPQITDPSNLCPSPDARAAKRRTTRSHHAASGYEPSAAARPHSCDHTTRPSSTIGERG